LFEYGGDGCSITSVEVVMLAVYPPMDSLQRTSSFGSTGSVLMRHPSAEDLDAAHQLVSSARGERSMGYVARDGQPTNSNSGDGPATEDGLSISSLESVRPSEEPPVTQESASSGQFCR